jgi:hypothetical protein
MGPVKNVAPERVPFGNEGMIKVIRRRAGHSQPFHNRPRSEVSDCRERDDFAQPKLLKAEIKGCAGTFRRVAATPIGVRKPPADLNARGERRLEAWDGQANESNELGNAWGFNGPEAKAVLREVIAH